MDDEFLRLTKWFQRSQGCEEILSILKQHKIDVDQYTRWLKKFQLSDGKRLARFYPPRFLENYNQSCALDSILFILFFADHSFFMDKMLSEQKSETPKGIKLRRLIEPLIIDLYVDYKKWTGNANRILQRMKPFFEDPLAGQCDDVHSGTEIWALLANAFMGLQFDQKVYSLIDQDTPDEIALLSNPPEFLIFGDDSRPMIRDLRTVHGLVRGGAPQASQTSVKETKVYKLVAALLFKPGHYVCAISTSTSNDWIYYNDVDPVPVRMANPERDIFSESYRQKIQMLFYRKVHM